MRPPTIIVYNKQKQKNTFKKPVGGMDLRPDKAVFFIIWWEVSEKIAFYRRELFEIIQTVECKRKYDEHTEHILSNFY